MNEFCSMEVQLLSHHKSFAFLSIFFPVFSISVTCSTLSCCLDSSLDSFSFLPVPSLIEELNKTSDSHSLYICMRIMILTFENSEFLTCVQSMNRHLLVPRIEKTPDCYGPFRPSKVKRCSQPCFPQGGQVPILTIKDCGGEQIQ